MIKKISYEDKIFVAGATGMVGKSVVKKLLENGYGKRESGGKLFIPTRKELNLIDQKSVQEWFEINKPDVVILAAAKVGGIIANSSYPFDFISENLKIQTNVIESSWRSGVRRFLFLGSSCIYPKLAEQPIKEESLLTGALEKTNEWYAISKIAGIKLCQSLRRQYGFDAISLMPTNLYGPGDNYHPTNSHVMAALIKKFYEAKINFSSSVTCWGTGNPFREFLFINDLADAVVFALENWDPDDKNAPIDKNGIPHYFLNVGTGKDISIFNLASLISNLIDFKGIIKWDKSKPDGTPKKQLEISQFKKLGWESKTSLEEGIRITIKDYITNLI